MKTIHTDDLIKMTQIAMQLTEQGAVFNCHEVNGDWVFTITGF